jgi:hypothetical protein
MHVHTFNLDMHTPIMFFSMYKMAHNYFLLKIFVIN